MKYSQPSDQSLNHLGLSVYSCLALMPGGGATSTSDIDFRVDKGQVKGFAFGGLINALSEALDKDVDVVTTASLDKDFLNYISKEEVLLYA